MGITQLDMLTGLDKVETAVGLLQAFEPPEGYYGAYSGGKDSEVIKNLAKVARVKADWRYCVSPIDPPEIRQHIKEYHPDVRWDYYARGFWKTVVEKGLPTRRNRWCCELIKEAGGLGRTVIVGNRTAESRNRRGQGCFGKHTKKDIFFVRPIINWSEGEVWEYIGVNRLPYCPLYDEGFKRLGCVMCPLATIANRRLEMQRFPKIARLWRLSCDRLVERRLAQGEDKFASGEELWQWWLSM